MRGVFESFQERKARGVRKPLRTLKEMAEEFGVVPQFLANRLRCHNGPKAELDNRNCGCRAHWYEPDEMRRWWAALPAEAKKQKGGV